MESDISKLRTLNKKIYSNIDKYDTIGNNVKVEFLKTSKKS